MTEDQGEEQPRNLLQEDELLYRQISLPLREGRPSWEVFKGRKDEGWQVSVDRSSMVDSQEATYLRHTDKGATSHGVLAVSTGELTQVQVHAYTAEEDDNPAHCQYDLKILATGTTISHGQREKICSRLLEWALDQDRPKYLPPHNLQTKTR